MPCCTAGVFEPGVCRDEASSAPAFVCCVGLGCGQCKIGRGDASTVSLCILLLNKCCKAFLSVSVTITKSYMSASVQGVGCFREQEEREIEALNM